MFCRYKGYYLQVGAEPDHGLDDHEDQPEGVDVLRGEVGGVLVLFDHLIAIDSRVGERVRGQVLSLVAKVDGVLDEIEDDEQEDLKETDHGTACIACAVSAVQRTNKRSGYSPDHDDVSLSLERESEYFSALGIPHFVIRSLGLRRNE